LGRALGEIKRSQNYARTRLASVISYRRITIPSEIDNKI
jgi:hypothetical protein